MKAESRTLIKLSPKKSASKAPAATLDFCAVVRNDYHRGAAFYGPADRYSAISPTSGHQQWLQLARRF
jgi:hypothetical protein